MVNSGYFQVLRVLMMLRRNFAALVKSMAVIVHSTQHMIATVATGFQIDTVQSEKDLFEVYTTLC
jgi:hypothetical protein